MKEVNGEMGEGVMEKELIGVIGGVCMREECERLNVNGDVGG